MFENIVSPAQQIQYLSIYPYSILYTICKQSTHPLLFRLSSAQLPLYWHGYITVPYKLWLLFLLCFGITCRSQHRILFAILVLLVSLYYGMYNFYGMYNCTYHYMIQVLCSLILVFSTFKINLAPMQVDSHFITCQFLCVDALHITDTPHLNTKQVHSPLCNCDFSA